MESISYLAFSVVTGLAAGMLHVVSGPDHLAAVAPLALQNRRHPWLTGLWWGIGHSTGVWIVGALAFLLKDFLPVDTLSGWSEKLVGVVLIILGLWAMRRSFRNRIHIHEHEHDGEAHVHIHFHSREEMQSHDHAAHQHTHAPLGIGILHGLAGSSHLLGVLPALALPGWHATVGYIVAFGLGSILAMTLVALVIGKSAHRLLQWSENSFQYLQYTFASLAILIGIYWVWFL